MCADLPLDDDEERKIAVLSGQGTFARPSLIKRRGIELVSR